MKEPTPAKKADATPDISPENLADNIKAISFAMNRLLKSGLNRKAIMVLVSHETGISQRQISAVVDSLQELQRRYT